MIQADCSVTFSVYENLRVSRTSRQQCPCITRAQVLPASTSYHFSFYVLTLEHTLFPIYITHWLFSYVLFLYAEMIARFSHITEENKTSFKDAFRCGFWSVRQSPTNVVAVELPYKHVLHSLCFSFLMCRLSCCSLLVGWISCTDNGIEADTRS